MLAYHFCYIELCNFVVTFYVKFLQISPGGSLKENSMLAYHCCYIALCNFVVALHVKLVNFAGMSLQEELYTGLPFLLH